MKKVLIIILDGCGKDAFLKANTPNIDKMIKEGLYIKDCQSVFPTITGPAHLSLLTGAYPEKTGITGHFYWDKKRRKLIDINGIKYCQTESLFNVIESYNKKSLVVGPRAVWFESGDNFFHKIIRKFVNNISSSQFIMQSPYLFKILRYFRDNNLFLNLLRGKNSNIAETLKDDRYIFFYLVLGEPDQVGHEYGPDSSQYLKVIEVCDKKIGMFMDLIKQSKDEIALIITSDHGQVKIDKRISLENISLEKIGYKISKIFPHPIGKEVRIIVYNKGKSNMAIATLVTRHVQIWLNNLNDIPRIIDFFKELEGVERVFTKEESSKLNLNHERLSDITFVLKPGYGFTTNNWVGDHGGLSEEEIRVPLIIWGKTVPHKSIDSASIVDIAPMVSKILGIRTPKDVQGNPLF
ncbi:MAG: alkaline phosphatase family protein [Patescibacteria group bacterium]